jgi:hypothetical protein
MKKKYIYLSIGLLGIVGIGYASYRIIKNNEKK